MSANRQILYLARTGAKLSNEQGRRVYFALPLGIRAVLEFDLRGEPNYFDGTLSTCPVQDYGAVDFYFAIDENIENTDTPALLKTKGITIETDERRHNIFRVTIPNTGTPELIEYLGKRDKAAVFAEIGGINASGETVFAYRFEMYVLNRVYAGGGEDNFDTDLSFITATADDILEGKLSVDADGEMIEGNIPTVEATYSENTVTVPPGYIADKQTITIPEAAEPTVSENVVTVNKGYIPEQIKVTIPEAAEPTVFDNTITVNKGYIPEKKVITVAKAAEPSVTDNTVTIHKGYQAAQKTVTIAEMAEPSVSANAVIIGKGYNAREKTVTIKEATAPSVSANVVTVNPGYIASKQTITIPEAGNLTVSDNVVTVPPGYIKSQRTVTIPTAAEPIVVDNQVTVNEGYQLERKTVTVGTAKGAATYTPGTTNQIIPAGLYLTGNQTIKGDSNLDGKNIAAGKSIFNKVGTFSNDATATAGDILYPKTAYRNGQKITGAIQTVSASLNGNELTVPAGFIAEAQTLTVAEAGEPTVSENKVTIKRGYNAAEKTVTIPEMTILNDGEKVIIPVGYNKTEQEIATGADVTLGMVNDDLDFQPVRFDGKDAVPEGIAIPVSAYYSWNNNAITLSDVPVISGMQYYDIEFDLAPYASAVNGKVKFSSSDLPVGLYLDGSIIKGSPSEHGSLAGGVTVSSKGASDKVLNIQFEIEEVQIPGDAIFYASFASEADTTESGHVLTVSGTPVYSTKLGVPCVEFDGANYMTFSDAGFPTGKNPRTMSCWFCCDSLSSYDTPMLFGYGTRSYGQFCGIYLLDDRSIEFCGHSSANNLTSAAGAFELGIWNHLAVVLDGDNEAIYVNGECIMQGTTGKNTVLGTGQIADTTDSDDFRYDGALAGVRVYDRALSGGVIKALAHEFTPVA